MLIDLQEYRRRRASARVATAVKPAQTSRAFPDWSIGGQRAGAAACALAETAADRVPLLDWEVEDLLAGASLV